MMPRVVVTGGSVGGLTAALVLRDAGHHRYGRPNVATLTTSSSNSTRRSSIEGSRSA